MNDRHSSPQTHRRILSLSLPYLSTDRLRRQMWGKSWRSPKHPEDPEQGANGNPARNRTPRPLAVVAKIKNALRLVALDESAEKLGLTRGMPLADARAMIPALAVYDEDFNADMTLIEEIARWTERFTPLVALDGHGLMLDITGSAHLFGGEEAMLADLVSRLGSQGFFPLAAIADTAGAASAAARYAGIEIVPEGHTRQILAPLPLAALRLDYETVSAMNRVGLKRIGQIIDKPRAPLAARFGKELIRRLDQALGIDEEAIDPRRPPPVFIAERRFPEPISREEDIAATLSSLAATIAQSLEAQGEGARSLEFSLFRVDGVVMHIAVGASRPVRAPKIILDLFREKFVALGDEEIDAGFGFDFARLAVNVSAPADPAQIDLAGEATAEADLDGFVDRIAVRLGPGSIGTIVPNASHVPERNQRLENGREGNPLLPVGRPALESPVRLFARPEPVEAIAEVPDGPPVHFRWRRASYRVTRVEGPERIAPEWWREDSLTRDYFRVEDSNGHRFWLYREGLYGREVNTPRWFMHGVFA
jgi:protein ImuB